MVAANLDQSAGNALDVISPIRLFGREPELGGRGRPDKGCSVPFPLQAWTQRTRLQPARRGTFRW